MAWLFGKFTAEKTVSATAKVLEVARDYGSERTIGKAKAEVAKATVDHKVAESALNVALKEEELRKAQLENDRLALENYSLRRTVDAEERQRILIERSIQEGQLDIADAIRALPPKDIQALSYLGSQLLAIEQRSEPDG